MKKLKLSLVVFMGLLAFAACSSKNEESKANSSAPAAASTAVVPYDATLSEGIQFEKPGYPEFIKSVSGMYGYEHAGRWTQGKVASFTFVKPLPANFRLHIEIAWVLSPDIGKPFGVTVGDWKGEFTVANASVKAIDLDIKTTKPVDSIEFTVPAPMSPKELKINDDGRILGIMFKRLSIEETVALPKG